MIDALSHAFTHTSRTTSSTHELFLCCPFVAAAAEAADLGPGDDGCRRRGWVVPQIGRETPKTKKRKEDLGERIWGKDAGLLFKNSWRSLVRIPSRSQLLSEQWGMFPLIFVLFSTSKEGLFGGKNECGGGSKIASLVVFREIRGSRKSWRTAGGCRDGFP